MTYNNYPGQPPQGQGQAYGGPRQGPPKDGGYLYPNEKKINAQSPDHKGKVRIGDDVVAAIMAGEREFYLSGWNKQDPKKGNLQFMSVKMKRIEARPQGQQYGQGPAQHSSYGVPPGQQYSPQVPHGPVQPTYGSGQTGHGPQRPMNQTPQQPQTQVNWQSGGDDIPF